MAYTHLVLFQMGNSHEYRETITPRPQSVVCLQVLMEELAVSLAPHTDYA